MKRSILQEISDYVPSNNRPELICSRADHILSSIEHLFELIDKSFPEQSQDIKRKFVNSIRTGDRERFMKMARQLGETK